MLSFKNDIQLFQIDSRHAASFIFCTPYYENQKVKELSWYSKIPKSNLYLIFLFSGLSSKTQELYMVVFCSRYLDLIYNFSHQNAYLIIMKLLFISATAYIIYLMRYEKPYCVVSSLNKNYLICSKSYDALGDDFKHWQYLIPGLFFFNKKGSKLFFRCYCCSSYYK